MVEYPVYVPRTNYRGSDKKKLAKTIEENRAAQIIEQAINKLVSTQKEPLRNYLWMEISIACGLPVETVARLGFGIDCGHGGFMVARPGLTCAQALEIFDQDLQKKIG